MIHVCTRNSLVHNMYTITWASLQKTVNVCTGIKQEKNPAFMHSLHQCKFNILYSFAVCFLQNKTNHIFH